jgi:hypothetical protein
LARLVAPHPEPLRLSFAASLLPQLLLRSAWCYSAVFGLLRGKYKNVAENVATSCYSMLSNDTAETKKPAVLAGFALS